MPTLPTVPGASNSACLQSARPLWRTSQQQDSVAVSAVSEEPRVAHGEAPPSAEMSVSSAHNPGSSSGGSRRRRPAEHAPGERLVVVRTSMCHGCTPPPPHPRTLLVCPLCSVGLRWGPSPSYVSIQLTLEVLLAVNTASC